MQVNNPDIASLYRPQKLFREHMHPPRQHDQVWLLGQHLLCERRIVPRARHRQLRRVRLAFGLKASRDHVKILGRDIGDGGPRGGIGGLAVHEEANDLRVGNTLRREAVEERLEVGAAAASHDDDARGRGGGRGGHDYLEVLKMMGAATHSSVEEDSYVESY